MNVLEEARIPIQVDADVLAARERARHMAVSAGFGVADQVGIATAATELARNILQYAGAGDVLLSLVGEGARRGIRLVAADHGPGIADTDLALQDGYSTSGSMGLGLPGAKRLMDDFAIVSEVGAGTTVTATKWRK